jgi:Coenzyme PQQ synthesis protein D (PqqD)
MKWAVSASVVWAESGGEVQLYDTTVGEFQTLNPTGAAIWRHLVENGEQAAVVAALAEQFGAQDDHQRRLITTDTDAFVRTLVEQGLIIEQPAGAP